jgi:hypothetical protein
MNQACFFIFVCLTCPAERVAVEINPSD